jgi:pimeloyl-ACP methyl ester carboxylesterase
MKDNVDSLASGRATGTTLHTQLQAIANAGHLSMLARPQAVANRILDFIATVPISPGE